MGLIVGVMGARGGAGASVVAAGLAHCLARSRPRGSPVVALVDLAPESGGIEVVLGIEGEAGLRWPDLADARGALDGASVLGRLPRWGAVAVVGATRDGPARVPHDAVADVCRALAETCDAVVLDLGRGILTGSPYGAAVLAACEEVLVVTPLDLPAVAGALVVRDALARSGVRAALVVRGPAPGTLDAVEVADAVGLEVACEVDWDTRMAGMVERGSGPIGGRGPLLRAGRRLAARYLDGDRS